MPAIGGRSPNRSNPAAVFRAFASFLLVRDRPLPFDGDRRDPNVAMTTVAVKHTTHTLSDGATLAYTLRAAPEPGAPKLALIHSLALDRTIWDGVVRRLDTQADILTYDCRGHGLSDRRAQPYTAELFATDLAEVLDHLGWEQATIGGCSMGGCVALAFGGLFPQRANALGLIDTTAWYGPRAAANFTERAEAARARGMAALFDF